MHGFPTNKLFIRNSLISKHTVKYGKFDNNEQIRKKVEAITSERLLSVAQEMFDVKNLTLLKYT